MRKLAAEPACFALPTGTRAAIEEARLSVNPNISVASWLRSAIRDALQRDGIMVPSSFADDAPAPRRGRAK